MTKEQYLLIMTKPEIPIELWYEFFLERGGSPIGLQRFAEHFSVVIQPGGTMVTESNGQPKFIDFNSALKKFYSYYNHKFGI